MTGRLQYADLQSRRDRLDTKHHRIDAPVEPLGDEIPDDVREFRITTDVVWSVGTEGFPLRESCPSLLARNRRVTMAYANLAHELTALFDAHGPEVRSTNWCSFAAWSSKTIGATIDPDEIPVSLQRVELPQRVKRALVKLSQTIGRRDHGAVFRALAAGNRYIFLEVGLVMAALIEHCSGVDLTIADDATRECRWSAMWEDVEKRVLALDDLGPDMVPTERPDMRTLEEGLRYYFDALCVPSSDDPEVHERQTDEKSELILAGGIRLAAYEQHRADGYVWAAMAIRVTRAFRNLLNRGTGKARRFHNRAADRAYAFVTTKMSLALLMPDRVVKLGRPMRGRRRPHHLRRDPLFPNPHVAVIDLAELQAVLAQYDRSNFHETRKSGARNWSEFADRMHSITNLFRAYHGDDRLREELLFTPEQIRGLILADSVDAANRAFATHAG